MRRAVLLLAAALAAAAPAVAQQQPGAGGGYAQRYAATCAACHGASGRSSLALTPSLAAQPSFYTITQLFLFRQGRRDNAAMTAIAKDLGDADLRGYSEHVATLPPDTAAPDTPRDAKRYARGEALARQHRCAACHGDDWSGGQQVPRLARQREDYLAHALRGFKSGQRVGYTPAMNETLSAVAVDEIDDLAHYLSHAGAR